MEYLTDKHYRQAAANGIDKRTLYARYYQYFWSIEEAIHTPKMKRFGNKEKSFTEEQIQTAEDNGISYQLMYKRKKLGWSIDRIISTPPEKRRKRV